MNDDCIRTRKQERLMEKLRREIEKGDERGD